MSPSLVHLRMFPFWATSLNVARGGITNVATLVFSYNAIIYLFHFFILFLKKNYLIAKVLWMVYNKRHFKNTI